MAHPVALPEPPKKVISTHLYIFLLLTVFMGSQDNSISIVATLQEDDHRIMVLFLAELYDLSVRLTPVPTQWLPRTSSQGTAARM